MQSTQQILSKGKQQIIEMAYELLQMKQPTIDILPEDYDITVWSNSREVIVKFKRLFRYHSYPFSEATSRSNPQYNITVNLVIAHISPFDDWFQLEGFHIATEEEKEIVAFVKEKANLPYTNSNGYVYHIYDEITHYNVYIRSAYSFTNYKLDKETGEKSGFNELLGTPAVTPVIEEEDPWIEIRE